IGFDHTTYPYGGEGVFELDMSSAELCELDHRQGGIMWGVLVDVREKKPDGTWGEWEGWGITMDILGHILGADYRFRQRVARIRARPSSGSLGPDGGSAHPPA